MKHGQLHAQLQTLEAVAKGTFVIVQCLQKRMCVEESVSANTEESRSMQSRCRRQWILVQPGTKLTHRGHTHTHTTSVPCARWLSDTVHTAPQALIIAAVTRPATSLISSHGQGHPLSHPVTTPLRSAKYAFRFGASGTSEPSWEQSALKLCVRTR